MSVIQRERSVAAGAVDDNLLSGSAFNIIRTFGVVTLGVVASATGGFVTFSAGPTLILEESPPTVKTAMPVIPDDMVYSSAVVPGDQLVLRCRNPTGGALTFRAICQIA